MPGIDGAMNAPMIASVAIVPLSSSLSNQRSRIGRAAPVSTSIASPMPGPSRCSARPILPASSSCPRLGRKRLGGICVSVGSTTEATRSSIASYFG